MRFEWEPKKNEVNIRKHGINFDEAETVFEDERAVTIYDKEHSDDEDRFKIIGVSWKLRELTVCHCLREDDDVTRIISARRATKSESKLYERGLSL